MDGFSNCLVELFTDVTKSCIFLVLFIKTKRASQIEFGKPDTFCKTVP